MSGGGGGYDHSPAPPVLCENLVFTAVLHSPVPAVVKQLKPQDKLGLQKTTAGAVVAEHVHHSVAGAIMHRLPNLLSCMDDGYDYVAVVQSINGLVVTVEVRPVLVARKGKTK
ncbi:hypothetical protein [Pseudobdellovibrio exovorus]|uniref:Uncharacterized protein n=1 Tax=Pseudobdellovibrio exovorus JSS TaxID=1184267 RepID=M4VMK7_9BACT|nr:hypothetical protein [Pseudobdellovibrio exovorus]AGH94319.1 hypothetical protein A11Q_99 [Pseudobdellovibrio exovorus JSS]